MQRAVTAIYPTYAMATLVRDELEQLGIGRRHITVIPDADRGFTSGSTRTTRMAETTVNTPGGAYVATPAGYADTAPTYSGADAAYGNAFDTLGSLDLPEDDTRVYQQAIRNGDYVVSVQVGDDADLSRIQEIMRRPEGAYDLVEAKRRHGNVMPGHSTSSTSGDASNVATDETGSLIAASKVNGTKVYNRQGEHLGSIYDVMINKRSGQVAYAVMSFGGFLGMGDSYHPLPWSMLDYDTGQGGYVVDLDKERLRGAPSYRSNEAVRWSDQSYTGAIDDYYGVSRYSHDWR